MAPNTLRRIAICCRCGYIRDQTNTDANNGVTTCKDGPRYGKDCGSVRWRYAEIRVPIEDPSIREVKAAQEWVKIKRERQKETAESAAKKAKAMRVFFSRLRNQH